MKFLTFYFSGTGNTKWAVNKFNEMIIEKGHKSEILSIEKKFSDKFLMYKFKGADYVGFANPIYGADIPPIMRGFINKVNTFGVKNKSIFFINTFGYVNALGPFAAKKLFANNFRMVGYVNIRMCNNISTPSLKTKVPDMKILNKRKKRGVKKLNKITDKIIMRKKFISGIGIYLLPGIIIRKKLKAAIAGNYRTLSIDMDRCSKCMKCIKNCPTKSIEYVDNNFNFLQTCTACMRCYNCCPKFSILINGQYADPHQYKRYDV